MARGLVGGAGRQRRRAGAGEAGGVVQRVGEVQRVAAFVKPNPAATATGR